MIDYDIWCRRCRNFEFNIENGIFCKLTNEKPKFDLSCDYFDYDPNLDQQVITEILKGKSKARRYRVIALSGMMGVGIYIVGMHHFIGKFVFHPIFITVPALVLIASLVNYFRWHRVVVNQDNKLLSLKINIPQTSSVSSEFPKTQYNDPGLRRFFFNWLWDHGVFRVKNKHVDFWIRREDYRNLSKVYEKCDASMRQYLVLSLKRLDTFQSRQLLIRAFSDRVYPVVEEAMNSLNELGLTDESLKQDMERIILQWEEDERRTQENWDKSSYTAFQEMYLDKSKMVRLKQAKVLLAKFKSSMSIG